MSSQTASLRFKEGSSSQQVRLTLRQSVCGLLIALILPGLSGCSSPSGGGVFSSRGDSIHELHLLVMPVALKFARPGSPDGFGVRVFASSRSRAKGVPIRSGTLDILAYDGVSSESALETAKPAQVWSYPAASLHPFAVAGPLGTGYELALPWQGTRPTGSRLTLVARYAPEQGAAVLAAPSIIPNSLK